MKIKQKKQLTLPQLIEWGFENDIKKATYRSENGLSVDFSFDGKAVIGYAFGKEDLFTVEVEEEIREDTRLDKLVVRYRNDDIYIFPQERIDDFKNDSSIVAFYIPNDDLTLTLIWRDGKMIE